MKQLFCISLIAICLCSGCAEYWDAAARAAEADAQARAAAARYDANAREYQAGQETLRAGMTAAVVPLVIVLLIVGVGGCIVLVWGGRIYMRKLELHHEHPQPQPLQLAPTDRKLIQLAARQGYVIVIDGQTMYLEDKQGRRVGRRLLEG